jgi:carboxyl-terminal processing protease
MTKLRQSGWAHIVRCALLLCPLFLSISSVLWIAYKRHLARVAVAPESRYFQRIYSVVSANFADPVSPEKAIYHGAIPGMLRTLDPHSTFFDQEEFRRHTQAAKGNHSGVGVELAYQDHQFIVVGCHSHSAALRAGIHPGDLVTALNGKPTGALSPAEVTDLLSRPEGTNTRISIVRDGRPLDFHLKTEVMARKSVPGVTWVRPGVAYLAILVFDEATPAELKENLDKCRQQGMQGLILDLRDNPGGVVHAAVAVADQFLRAGETILHQRGRAFAAATYVATHGNDGHEYPMVILVNRNTASAAEAVAGALQDHDRAWVLGDDTYGKGLVQTVTSLPANTGLALVKSRYYTPSGRLLQRLHYNALGHYERRPATHLVAWMTDSGRPVYAGAGIGPDEHFAPQYDRFQSSLTRRFACLQFTSHYLNTQPIAINERWQADEATLREFRDYLKQHNFKFTNAEFVRHDGWIRQRLRQAMLRTAFGLDETFDLLVATDTMVERALHALPTAKVLLDSARSNPHHLRLADAQWCGPGGEPSAAACR